MTPERLNADFTRRVVVATGGVEWIASPQAGIDRRPLDRIGGEVARATSLVRYAAGSAFPAHDHALGEEFLVLSGVFADEHGDYPAGTYVRNPPGSRHAPRTAPGCTILVKLRQMDPRERARVVLDTNAAGWQAGERDGHARLDLHSPVDKSERVTMQRLDAGVPLADIACPGGEEIFVVSGELADTEGTYGPATWIRNPPGSVRRATNGRAALFWVKSGHLGNRP
ncbi:MAG: cupin domain-containing protein [Proteobacteria bacterium]|nr:cupin domain-containing protein [Pseudomonadota bacterium]